MNIAIIVMIIIGVAGFAMLFAAVQWRSGYIDDLNKKLSALLNNPVIHPNYQFKSLVSGTYQGHEITFEWSPPSQGQWGVLLYAKIYNLDIPALQMTYRSDIPAGGAAKLWQELSSLKSVQSIDFSDHILQIKMLWVSALVDEKTGTVLAGTIADSWTNTNTDRITQDVGATLDKLLKILELSP